MKNWVAGFVAALILLSVFAGSYSFAKGGGGGSVSGGGHGVEIKNHVYLLDLFEQNKHLNPEFAGADIYHLNDLFLPQNVVPGLTGTEVTEKISDIGLRDPVLAAVLMKAIEAFSWNLTPLDLKALPADTQVKIPVLQVAARTGDRVMINSKLWSKMDQPNRVALIIHEALAAVADRELLSQPTVRSLTANVFDLNYYLRRKDSIEAGLRFFPSLIKFSQTYLAAYKQTLGIDEILVSYTENVDLLKPGRSSHPPRDSRIVPSDQYHFAPVLKLRWKNGASVTEEFFQVKASNVSQANDSASPCERPLIDRKLVSIEAGFFRTDVKLDDQLEDGYPLPRMNWSPAYEARAVLNFEGPTSTKVADCSAQNVAQTAELRTWLAGFQLFYK